MCVCVCARVQIKSVKVVGIFLKTFSAEYFRHICYSRCVYNNCSVHYCMVMTAEERIVIFQPVLWSTYMFKVSFPTLVTFCNESFETRL